MDTSVEEKPKQEPLPQRSNGPKTQSDHGSETKPFNQNQHNRVQNQQNRGQNQQQKRAFGGQRRNNDSNDQRGPNQRIQREGGRNNEVSYKMASKISKNGVYSYK